MLSYMARMTFVTFNHSKRGAYFGVAKPTLRQPKMHLGTTTIKTNQSSCFSVWPYFDPTAYVFLQIHLGKSEVESFSATQSGLVFFFNKKRVNFLFVATC